ncbi:MAG TPA: hypothetical protein VNZ52_00715, partial [Candidatus Thermoplasmatota archaeon]|nr:hypothetical protein [Candidatus Thermoplasmatota archaeon]
AGPPLGVPFCLVGVLVDLSGSDAMNSFNGLRAWGSEVNHVDVTVDATQGAALANGFGILVNGLLSTDATAVLKGYLDPCLGSPCSFHWAAMVQGSANDAYTSFNSAPGTRTFDVTRSLGSVTAGHLALLLDSNVPALGSGHEMYHVRATKPDVDTTWMVGASLPNTDSYISWNRCDFLVSTKNLGYAAGFLGAAFVDLFGDDAYDQNPWCGGSYAVDGYGYAATADGLALFADLGGVDAYPTLKQGGFLVGAQDDVAWTGTSPGLGHGVDLLSVLW